MEETGTRASAPCAAEYPSLCGEAAFSSAGSRHPPGACVGQAAESRARRRAARVFAPLGNRAASDRGGGGCIRPLRCREAAWPLVGAVLGLPAEGRCLLDRPPITRK